MGKIKQKVVAILLVLIFWGVIMPFLPSIITSIANIMEDYNLTKIDVPMQRYENGTWQEEIHRVDLKGIFMGIMAIVIFLAPIIILYKAIT